MPRPKKKRPWQDFHNMSERRRGSSTTYRARLCFPVNRITGVTPAPRDFYGKTPEEADDKRSKFLAAADLKTQFSAYIRDEFLPACKKTDQPTTYEKRRYQCQRYFTAPPADELPNIAAEPLLQAKLGDITPEMVRSYALAMERDNVPPHARVHLRSQLRVSLGEAEGRLSHQLGAFFDFNIWRKLRAPQPKPKALPDDLDGFTTYLLGKINDPTLPLTGRALVAFQTMTFCRPSELGALLWSDVDLDAGTAVFDKAMRVDRISAGTKNGSRSNRVARLPGLVVDLLRQLKVGATSEHVFTNPQGLPLTKDRRRPIWENIVRSWSLPPDLTFYSLKTLGVSWAQGQGVNAAVVAAACGHVDTKMVLSTYRMTQTRERTELAGLFDAQAAPVTRGQNP